MQRTLSDEVQIIDSHPQPPSTSCSTQSEHLRAFCLLYRINKPSQSHCSEHFKNKTLTSFLRKNYNLQYLNLATRYVCASVTEDLSLP